MDAELFHVIAALRADPERAAILSDIDGTLAPIVIDPGASRVPPETSDALEALADRYRLVACISGRRAADARQLVGVEGIVYVGLHGLELIQPGGEEAVLDPALGAHAGAVQAFLDGRESAELSAGGLRVEDKGPIQAIHWRGVDDEERAEDLARTLAVRAREAGLVPRFGRKVLELRPTGEIDKGTVTERLLEGPEVDAALFGGDDETDLDAFRALRRLRQAGRLRVAVSVGVASAEPPPGLRENTDALVTGTGGFLEVLQALAPEAAG